MNLTKRFINAAKAELKSVVRKITEKNVLGGLEAPQTDRKNSRQENTSTYSQDRLANLPLDVCRAYEIVDLPIGTSFDEIQTAYRRQKKKTSKHPGTHSKTSQKEVEKAYEALAAYFEKSLRSKDTL